jgi:hypothetical protein
MDIVCFRTKALCLFFGAASCLCVAPGARANTIAEWTFETSYTSFDGSTGGNGVGNGIAAATISGISADIGSGTASAHHASTS